MSKKKITCVIIYLVSIVLLAVSFIIGIFNIFNHYNELNTTSGYDSTVGLDASFKEEEMDDLIDAYINKYYSDNNAKSINEIKQKIKDDYYLSNGIYYYKDVPQINYYLVITCGIISVISLLSFIIFVIIGKRC